jgi:protein-tyrosine phosphatase
MFPAKEVAPGLWVGSFADITDKRFLQTRNIRLVVNCTNSIPSIFFQPTIEVPLFDDETSRQKMQDALPRIVPEILKYRRRGQTVLIHCVAGISRSASVAAAVLMVENGLTAVQAMALVQSKKPETFGTKGADGRPVFLPVLQWWERYLSTHISDART